MDIILYNIIGCLVSLILGYFFGSIPTGVILCKIFYNADPRENGSKNSGGTNVGRLYGKKIGVATIVLDAIKTIFPLFLVWILIKFCKFNEIFAEKFGENLYHNGLLIIILAPLGASIGHCWPIFANFRGGKAVACYAGFAFATCWVGLIASLISFFTTLKISKHVSLGSIISSAIFTLISWVLFALNFICPELNTNFAFWGFGKSIFWVASNLEFCIVSTLIFLILILRHIPNIKRLASGTESKIKWMK